MLGATPALRPMAQPLAVQVGATPAPRRNPLMELAESFNGVNEELRTVLRDASAREERDAQAIGEIEAGRLAAAGRLAELDKVLKMKVDAGELPAVRLPAAQRGASIRAGHEHADVGLRTFLMGRKADIVAGRAPLEDVIAEGVSKFGEAIGPNAFYERLGFEKGTQDVLGAFRKRVGEEQAQEAERFQNEKRANEGTELLFQLATADSDTAPTAKGFVKTFLDTIHSEMKGSDVNPLFSENMLKPAVARLVETRNFEGAAQLLEEAKTIDLTGKGGLYGKTALGSETILTLSNLVEQKSRLARSADADRLREEAYIADRAGQDRAAKDVYDLQNQFGGDMPASERQRLQDEARKALSPVAYQAYQETLNHAYENHERWRKDEQTAALALGSTNTLDPARLADAEAKLEFDFNHGSLSAATYHAAKQNLERNKALSTLVQSNDVENFRKEVFAIPEVGSYGNATTVVFAEAELQKEWGLMDENARTELQNRVVDYFVDQYRQEIRTRTGGDPAKAEGSQVQARLEAAQKATKLAKTLLTSQTDARIKADADRRALAQARAVREAKSKEALTDSPFKLQADMTTNAIDFRGAKVTLSEKGNFSEEALKLRAKDRPLPKAEKDFVSVAFRARGLYYPFHNFKDKRLVYMPALAEEAIAKPDGESAQIYAVAKSTAGFTPEEIKAGKTKHGVLFDPSQIDPRIISVFRSVSELNKHWNNGAFDETFAALGDAVDSQDTMTPQQFYLAQVALLSK